MPTITIKNLDNKSIDYNDRDQSVLSVLHENGVDWMHACGAKGRCTTCKMIVHEGMSAISENSPFETQSKSLGKLNDNERLACQCSVSEDLIISVPEVSKLPHLNYSK
jgi:2Fe-2S ferredoxin